MKHILDILELLRWDVEVREELRQPYLELELPDYDIINDKRREAEENEASIIIIDI